MKFVRCPGTSLCASLCVTLFAAHISLLFVCGQSAAQSPADAAAKFVDNQCIDCHDGSDGEGGFDVASLEGSLDDEAVMKKWVRVFDRVELGEMPPPEDSSLSKSHREAFVSNAGQWLRSTQQSQFEQLGRVRGRRLSNRQLERSLHDLLGIDIPLERLMSEEQKAEGFKNVVSAQSMSHFQMEQHLTVVDAALDEAFNRALKGDEGREKFLPAKDLVRRRPRSRTREPELIDGHAVTWSSNMMYYGRLPATTARDGGWYRFQVNIKALKVQKDYEGIWCTVRHGKCVSSAPLLGWVTSFEAMEEPKTVTFETWLPEGEMLEIRAGDVTLKKGRFQGGQVGAGEGGPQNIPGIAIKWIKMQRIYPNADEAKVRKLLVGDLEIEPGSRREPANVLSKQPKQDAESLLVNFASRAFRRPVENSEIASYISHVHTLLDNGEEFRSAIQNGYRALLCSPRFMYFQEPAGDLDQYAIASRLSYFLWNRMPDDELLRLADEGKLNDRRVLQQQVDRMLDGSRGKNFVEDFTEDWLDLDLIDFTQPDRRLYPGFDVVVQQSMVDETHAFVQNMLDRNASVAQLINSRYTFLNERLARFYGIDGVKGDRLRKVELKPEHRRGGLMTQGAVLKVTANGTTTSPVVRGVWVGERLLGQHVPPPPASISAIEPDIRGAKTIREMLEKHKADQSCAVCHVTIDPPGFALENYDPSGRWRDSYYIAKRMKKNQRDKMQIDPSSQMADGRKFDDLDGFRKLILADKESLAENVAEKLLIYGTGQRIHFADRPHVSAIAKETSESNYGFRSIIHEVVASPVFLKK